LLQGVRVWFSPTWHRRCRWDKVFETWCSPWQSIMFSSTRQFSTTVECFFVKTLQTASKHKSFTWIYWRWSDFLELYLNR
jgi:hypothetical protein